MPDPQLPGLQPSVGLPEKRGRGRPKGATGRRSTDLMRYIEARYAGLTPGQIMAEIALLTPRDLARAAKGARAVGLPPATVAMATKALELGKLLGCTTAEAWALMAKERAELMPYVHQKRPQQVDLGDGTGLLPMVVFAAPQGGPVIDLPFEENQGLSGWSAVEVSPLKSHDEDEGEQ